MNRPLTLIDVLAARLTEIAGEPIRLGQTGIRATFTPVPMHTPDAYTQCVSVDFTDAGLVRILDKLGITSDLLTALTAPAAQTGTEAA